MTTPQPKPSPYSRIEISKKIWCRDSGLYLFRARTRSGKRTMGFCDADGKRAWLRAGAKEFTV